MGPASLGLAGSGTRDRSRRLCKRRFARTVHPCFREAATAPAQGARSSEKTDRWEPERWQARRSGWAATVARLIGLLGRTGVKELYADDCLKNAMSTPRQIASMRVMNARIVMSRIIIQTMDATSTAIMGHAEPGQRQAGVPASARPRSCRRGFAIAVVIDRYKLAASPCSGGRQAIGPQRSSASAGGRVKISILLRRYGRITGKLVPPRRDDLIVAGTNDDVSRFGVVPPRGVGRSTEGDQKA